MLHDPEITRQAPAERDAVVGAATMAISLRSFRRAESGVASIEFALISTVLLLLFAGCFDLVYMVQAKRDADRASTLIVRAMTSCSNMSCMQDLLNTYPYRESNALVRYPTATLNLYVIARLNGQISTCYGTQKVLTDSDVLASALNIMRDADIGAAVVLTTTYTSILPKFLVKYISSSGASYRDYTVDVFSNFSDNTTAKSVCAGTS